MSLRAYTRCPFCRAQLPIVGDPRQMDDGGGPIPPREVGPLLVAFLQIALDYMEQENFLMAVHTVTTTFGMLRTCAPEVVEHDCPEDYE